MPSNSICCCCGRSLRCCASDHEFEGLRKKIVGDRQPARGAAEHPDGRGGACADPGASDRRILAGHHRADAGDGAAPAARPDQADRSSKRRRSSTRISRTRSGQGPTIEVSGVPVGTDMDRFRAKARQFLKANENHIAILKLHRNEPLTPDRSERARAHFRRGRCRHRRGYRAHPRGRGARPLRALAGRSRPRRRKARLRWLHSRAAS